MFGLLMPHVLILVLLTGSPDFRMRQVATHCLERLNSAKLLPARLYLYGAEHEDPEIRCRLASMTCRNLFELTVLTSDDATAWSEMRRMERWYGGVKCYRCKKAGDGEYVGVFGY